jgi:hypothetical protein
VPSAEDVFDRVEQARVFESLFPTAKAERARVGRFELLRRIGRGGMGEVYEGVSQRFGAGGLPFGWRR